MTIWIVTTGNSDVQLNTDANWKNLWRNVRDKFNNLTFEPVKNEEEERFTVPARVMGIVYGNQPDTDLDFPLLDTFSKLLHDKNVKPDKIIFILTDQENLFSSTNRRKNSPYWQDTYTLKPIFERYFKHKQKFPYTKVIEKTLQPKSGEKGLDNWNQVLTMVGNILSDPDVEFKKGEDIYVSHQAGTPAISSAVQFMSLSRFGKNVKFLVSNEYSKSADIVESSTYLRGIQIQQVKALIYPGGSPGAAKKLIEVEKIDTQTSELDKLVNFFNLNHSEVKEGSEFKEEGSEFKIEAATQRIVDALDLIGRFFNNKNYLQGITLLAAAQETFLKVAIKKEIQGKRLTLQIRGKSQTFNAEDLIQWQQAGLLFIRNPKDKGIYTDNLLKQVLNLTDADNEELSKIKREVLKQVNFPVSDFSKKLDKKNFNVINSNDGLLKWLRQLRSDFKAWKLLEWSCILKDKNSQYEDDLRNQLMHNLLGVEESEVIKYLLGNPDKTDVTDVMTAYNNHVKSLFIAEIKHLGLTYKTNKLEEQLKKLANDIR